MSRRTAPQDAHRIAAEFTVWAAGQGWTPGEVMALVGRRWIGRHGFGRPDWHDATQAVIVAWYQLPVPIRARATEDAQVEYA